jgi:hypothetical protein
MKKIWAIILSLMFLFSLNLISGCQQSTEKTAGSNDKAAGTTAGYGNKAAPSGEHLRKLIYEQTPYQEWALWPGKGKLYKGTESHGAYITVYVNDTALESIKNAKGMADNSIVLKENYTADKELASVTVMQKVKVLQPLDFFGSDRANYSIRKTVRHFGFGRGKRYGSPHDLCILLG